MKKIFTLIAVAAMSIAASAQGTYQYDSEAAVPAGTTVQAVPNCTLTFGAAGDADFKAAKADTHVEGFTHFCEGNGNNPKVTDGAIVSGTAYELKPALDGKITVAVILNANKSFYVLQDGVALPEYDGIRVDPKAYTTYSFDVTGGKTYIVYCAGSKLGFYGFTYEVTGGDTPEPVEGEAFTVSGQGRYTWGKEYNDIVTPFEFNYETMVATYSNFVGSTSSFALQFTKNEPNAGDTTPGTIYNSEGISGLSKPVTDEYGYAMSKINGFDGSIILTIDGVNAGKLDNIEIGVGFGSQIEVKALSATERVFEVVLFIGGTYSAWDAEKSEWVSSGTSEYVKLIKNVPTTPGPTSNIDEVAVDFDENAPVEYFNLQGVRVAEPSNGVFIKRQGNKVVKVLVK